MFDDLSAYFHNCIDLRNVKTKITNCMCLLSTIDLGSTTTLILWTIPLTMILTTYPTLQWFSTTASILLLSMSHLSCIELLIRDYILFITCILRYSSLWWPFSFSFLISFQVMLWLNLALRLIITMFKLSDGLLQRSRLIKPI